MAPHLPFGTTHNPEPPTYLDNIPMTATGQVDQETMPYRPRERPLEKAYRQLCCGSCWSLCGWITGVLILLTTIIITQAVLATVSD
jgi:hypothetical protein